MRNAYGRNTAQVEAVLGKLREMPDAKWKSLERAHDRATTREAAEDTLADVLSRHDLRQSWFDLRAEATVIAKKAAADYAADTGEEVRTIEHVAAVNAWDGQHEASSFEVLGPAHERGFIDGACWSLGVVLMRPYVSDPDFRKYWDPYESAIGLLSTEG